MMEPTHHILHVCEAGDAAPIADGSVALVVTSPPYPMIRMWDGAFASLDPAIRKALRKGAGGEAFELMHCQLDRVWKAMHRVLMPGGILCINVGDATRSIGGEFQLYTNHSRILESCRTLGFRDLPNILWRKPTNAPTKFMGSGMLPAGAYVTLEHEYVLVLRKGNRRAFPGAQDRLVRRQSAYFWEERNRWFSDLWEIRGADQMLGKGGGRARSAAFPFEIAFRLVLMYSCSGDLVLDPFLGTGTTMLAAAACGRNSAGFELDRRVAAFARKRLLSSLNPLNDRLRARLDDHLEFVNGKGPGALRYANRHHSIPVMTRQETELTLTGIESIQPKGGYGALVHYQKKPLPLVARKP